MENKADKSGSFFASFFCIDNVNNIWFHYHGILCEWNTATKSLQNKFNNACHKKIFETNITDLIQDANGNYWTASGLLLNCYDRSFNSCPVNLKNTANQLMYLTLSKSGKIWITNDYQGICIYDTAHKSFQLIHHNVINNNSPSDGSFRKLYKDKDGNIWMPPDYGLDKCTDLSNKFIVLNNFGYDDPLTQHTKFAVNDVSAYKNYLLICTTGGFFKINTENLK